MKETTINGTNIELEDYRGLHRTANDESFYTVVDTIKNRVPEFYIRIDDMDSTVVTYRFVEMEVHEVEGKYIAEIEDRFEDNYYVEESIVPIEEYLEELLTVAERNEGNVEVKQNKLGLDV